MTFTFPSTGNVRMEASAADTMNLNSGNSEMTWTIYDDGGGGDDAPLDINWASLIIALILLAGAVIVYLKVPMHIYLKLLLTLGMLAGAGYFMMQAFGV